VTRLAFALCCALLLGSCVPHTTRRLVAVPEAIRPIGGVLQPWTPRHEAEVRELIACLGLRHGHTASRPTLWLSFVPLWRDGYELVGYYDTAANAIVFSPIVDSPERYWLVFRHEMIHQLTGRSNADPIFVRAGPCRFWPAG
jgi:hypothetical protein